MATFQMKFLSKLCTKIVFSDDSNLNILAADMGEGQVNIQVEGEVVNRPVTATGTVGSLAIFSPVNISVEILKTSPAYENYIKRCRENGYVGGTVTVYDDVNMAHTFYEPSINTQEFPAMNGTTPAHTFIINANWEVNSQALAGI